MMTNFRVVDPDINADYGIILATNSRAALDAIARRMGWASYAEYTAAAANHSGTRTLLALEMKVSA